MEGSKKTTTRIDHLCSSTKANKKNTKNQKRYNLIETSQKT